MEMVNFGKYPVPDMLKKVIALQKQLTEEGLLEYGDLLGVSFTDKDEEIRYLNTPLDAVIFGWAGADGIHYAFLTDFGQVSSLEEACIVRVSPMDFDDPVELVAASFYDFLRLMVTPGPAFEVFSARTTRAYYDDYFKRYPEDTSEPPEDAAIRLREAFGLEPVPDVFEYMSSLRQNRQDHISYPTEDKIGIVLKDKPSQPFSPKILDRDDYLEEEEIADFFSKGSQPEVLAFLRDAQSLGILHENTHLQPFLEGKLLEMGLADEAARLDRPEDRLQSGMTELASGTVMVSYYAEEDE